MLLEEESSSCLPNFIVILSIPLLIFLSSLVSYLGYLSLKVEIHTLVTLGFIFFIFIFFIKHNANYTACKFRQSFYEIEDKIKKFIKDNELEINGKRKSLADIDELLFQEVKDMRNDNFATIAPTVFPMLGILGTFIAIAISMPNFSVQSTEALDKEITILLSGVGTAFYASIYGIFLSLWWIFFEKRGISKLNYTIDYIKRVYSKYIWDKNELDRYKYKADLESNMSVVETLKDIFNLDMIKSLNQRYVEDFQIIADKTANSFNKITNDMQSVTSDFENSLRELYKSENALKATVKIDDTLKDFTKVIENLKDTIDSVDTKLNSDIDRNFEKVDEEIAKIVVKLADFGFLLDEQVQKIFLAVEQYHKEVLKNSKR